MGAKVGQDPQFQGHPDLTTTTLDNLVGKRAVQKQYIQNLLNMPQLKQGEKDVLNNVLSEYHDTNVIPVQEFADKVHSRLLPLSRDTQPNTRYDSVNLPYNYNTQNYQEHVYNSPIETSAGNTHFGHSENAGGYFGHTRTEDVKGNLVGSDSPFFDPYHEDPTTRRVLEVQSDLFQKGGLEQEAKKGRPINFTPELNQIEDQLVNAQQGTREYRELLDKRNQLIDSNRENPSEPRSQELARLQPYKNTWHERLIREEVQQAAKDGIQNLHFPTGDTAMKIEGLAGNGDSNFLHYENSTYLQPHDLQTGQKFNDQRFRGGGSGNFVITEKTGDNTFKAVPLNYDAPEILQEPQHDSDPLEYNHALQKYIKENKHAIEEFSLASDVDSNNPIHKFYEGAVAKYVKKLDPNAQKVTDPQGATWLQMNIQPHHATQPINAFAKKEDDKNSPAANTA